MAKKSKYPGLPNRRTLIETAYEIIRNENTEVSDDELTSEVASKLNLSNEVVNYRCDSGESKLHYEVRWALTYLGSYGAIVQPKANSGLWQLSNDFKDIISVDGSEVDKAYRNRNKDISSQITLDQLRLENYEDSFDGFAAFFSDFRKYYEAEKKNKMLISIVFGMLYGQKIKEYGNRYADLFQLAGYNDKTAENITQYMRHGAQLCECIENNDFGLAEFFSFSSEQSDNIDEDYQDITMINEVYEAIKELGGSASCQEIYEKLQERGTFLELYKGKQWQKYVRAILQRFSKGEHPRFLAIKRGFWSIIDEHTSLVEVADYDVYKKTSITDSTNKIYYGTPGCGKSYYVSHNVVSKKQSFNQDFVFRTTFHQEYTNVDFVGQVLPVVNGVDVSYKFIPGPFTLALECAIDHPSDKVALVIEELNRGNAASIFGDIFQLLDRIEEEKDEKELGLPIGTSIYSIVNVGISNYFRNRATNPFELDEIRIPANLFIYATMNTSDQNVFTLDTAFKRRWEAEKLSNIFGDNDKDKEGKTLGDYYIPCDLPNTITWRDFIETVNHYMISKGKFDSEDKQIGKYFVGKSILCKEKDEINTSKSEQFAYKVLEYIWSDVARFNREDWFDKDINSFDSLVKEFKEKGFLIFNKQIGFKYPSEEETNNEN